MIRRVEVKFEQSEDWAFMRQMGFAIDRMVEEPYKDYWFHFGRFIHIFSRTEHSLVYLLRTVAGLSPPVGGILLAGVGVEQAKESLRQLLNVLEDDEAKRRLEGPLKQFGVINTVRSRLVHWGVRQDFGNDGGFVMSNAAAAPSETKLKEYRVTLADFEAMTEDLDKISLSLHIVAHPPTEPFPEMEAYLTKPWAFKEVKSVRGAKQPRPDKW